MNNTTVLNEQSTKNAEQIARLAHALVTCMMDHVLHADSSINWEDAVFSAGLASKAMSQLARHIQRDDSDTESAYLAQTEAILKAAMLNKILVTRFENVAHFDAFMASTVSRAH